MSQEISWASASNEGKAEASVRENGFPADQTREKRIMGKGSLEKRAPEDGLSPPSQESSDPHDKRRIWERRLEQCRQSGLSQKIYCQQNGLKLPQFYYWRKRLASDRGKVSFLPLPLPGGRSAPYASCGVRIVAPNGFAIELDHPAPLSELLALVAAL